MTDADALARQMTALVAGVARRFVVLATGVVIVTLIIGGLSYLTGLVALEGSARSAWTVIGGAMLVVAVGAPLLARWRLSRVGKHVTQLVTDLGRVISRDPDAKRVVVDTVTVDQPTEYGTHVPAVIETRQFSRLQTATLSATDLPNLLAALRAVTTFPWLLAIGVVLMLVFGVLGFVFLVAWVV